MSLDRFYKGRFILLVAGWFGEINRDFERTVVTLAKETAASDFGRTLLPQINIDLRQIQKRVPIGQTISTDDGQEYVAG